MARYIDADAIHEKYDRYANHSPFGRGHGKTLARFLDWIDEEPTADVVEVVHGEWFPIDVGDCCYRCSVCNFVRDAYLLEEDNYCPHCGAKMDGAV